MTNFIRLIALIAITGFGFNANAESKKPNVEKNEITNVIEFNEEFNEDSIEVLLSEIEDSVDEGDKLVSIKLNSPGGSIFAGIKLINKLAKYQSKGIKFRGIVGRYCMSMCFVTLQVLDERLIYKYGMLLDHPASGGNNQGALIEISELFNEMIYARLRKKGLSEVAIKQYKLLVANEFLMNSKTALALGLVDRVINPGEENVKEVKSNK